MSNMPSAKLQDLLQERVTAKTVGQLNQNEIEYAIQLIRHTDSLDHKNSYALSLASHLALTGGLNDLTVAVELVKQANSDPYNRHHAITELCTRYLAIEDKAQALQLAGLMENDASSLEIDNRFFPAQRAFLWMELSALFFKIGAIDKANGARNKAIKLAIAGQSYERGPQEAYECIAILGGIIKDLISQEKFAEALEIVYMWEWKHKSNWIEALKLLAHTKPG